MPLLPRPPPPPTPTPSPYTTLFRSPLGHHDQVRTDHVMGGEQAGVGGHGFVVTPERLSDGDGRGQPIRLPQCRYRDRKSTRLNSSHVAISYAVFCLKKKTKQQPRRT